MPNNKPKPLSSDTINNIKNTDRIPSALQSLGTTIQTIPTRFPKGQTVYGSTLEWTSAFKTWKGYDEPQTHN